MKQDKDKILSELTELFGKNGIVQKDFSELKESIKSLTATLSNKKEEDKKQRTIAGDWKDFTQEIKDSLWNRPKTYITGKKDTYKDNKEESDNVDVKNTKDESDIKFKKKGKPKSVASQENSKIEITRNKILSDMVEVLIDLKDDKTQSKINLELLEINRLINSTKNNFKNTIEPNDDAAKQEDQEKLAEAIARRLSDIVTTGKSGVPNIPSKKIPPVIPPPTIPPPVVKPPVVKPPVVKPPVAEQPPVVKPPVAEQPPVVKPPKEPAAPNKPKVENKPSAARQKELDAAKAEEEKAIQATQELAKKRAAKETADVKREQPQIQESATKIPKLVEKPEAISTKKSNLLDVKGDLSAASLNDTQKIAINNLFVDMGLRGLLGTETGDKVWTDKVNQLKKSNPKKLKSLIDAANAEIENVEIEKGKKISVSPSSKFKEIDAKSDAELSKPGMRQESIQKAAAEYAKTLPKSLIEEAKRNKGKELSSLSLENMDLKDINQNNNQVSFISNMNVTNTEQTTISKKPSSRQNPYERYWSAQA